MKTIQIRGIDYCEAPYTEPVAKTEDGAICAQCALHSNFAACGEAIGRSAGIFGGDCVERDVIYTPAPVKQRETV